MQSVQGTKPVVDRAPKHDTTMESVMESACDQDDPDRASTCLEGQLPTTGDDDVRLITFPRCDEEMDPMQSDQLVLCHAGDEENLTPSDELPDEKSAMRQMILNMLINRRVDDTEETDALNGNSSLSSLGFPNIGHTCYMNSCLQSLLTLQDFVKDLSDHESLLETVSEAQVMWVFVAIKDAHSSTEILRKICLLYSFKETISVLSPEFKSYEQKDAHEFLTSILYQTRDLARVLKEASKNQSYRCPVENNMLFCLENVRMCTGCGVQSVKLEEYLNLSLDLVLGGSVRTMLEGYFKEMELQYSCSCGANTSSQRSTIDVPPKVLILHLKRFMWTQSYSFVKRNDRVELSRELEVPTNRGAAHYDLVSAISHLGPSVNFGHYICDRVHPDRGPDEPSDRWLTLSDLRAEETSGESVCQKRQTSAYILFYQKQDQDQEQPV